MILFGELLVCEREHDRIGCLGEEEMLLVCGFHSLCSATVTLHPMVYVHVHVGDGEHDVMCMCVDFTLYHMCMYTPSKHAVCVCIDADLLLCYVGYVNSPLP